MHEGYKKTRRIVRAKCRKFKPGDTVMPRDSRLPTKQHYRHQKLMWPRRRGRSSFPEGARVRTIDTDGVACTTALEFYARARPHPYGNQRVHQWMTPAYAKATLIKKASNEAAPPEHPVPLVFPPDDPVHLGSTS